MLRTIESQLTRVVTRPLASGVTTGVEEGACLEGDYDNDGRLVVKPSTGSTGLFVGFAIGEIAAPKTLVAVETFSLVHHATEKRTFTLEHSYANSGRAYSATQAFTEDANTDTAYDWSASGTTLTVKPHTSGADLAFTFIYRYTPTVIDIRRVQGDVHPGQHVTLDRGEVGVIEAGSILFDMFDTTKDWSAVSDALFLTMGTGGRVTTGTDVSARIRGVITRRPFHSDNAETALMGLSFSI